MSDLQISNWHPVNLFNFPFPPKQDLESKFSGAEDRHCHEMSIMKDKHYKEIGALEKQFKEQTADMTKLIATLKTEVSDLFLVFIFKCQFLLIFPFFCTELKPQYQIFLQF